MLLEQNTKVQTFLPPKSTILPSAGPISHTSPQDSATTSSHFPHNNDTHPPDPPRTPPPATTPPPPPNRSEAAEAFYEAQLVLVSARAEQTLCASGSAYLQPRCVLLVADLQRLPLVLLLLQLAIAVRQLFHQTCVLGTQLVQLC